MCGPCKLETYTAFTQVHLDHTAVVSLNKEMGDTGHIVSTWGWPGRVEQTPCLFGFLPAHSCDPACKLESSSSLDVTSSTPVYPLGDPKSLVSGRPSGQGEAVGIWSKTSTHVSFTLVHFSDRNYSAKQWRTFFLRAVHFFYVNSNNCKNNRKNVEEVGRRRGRKNKTQP